MYHIRGWGKFNRHYGDFCTGADMQAIICGTAHPSYMRNLPPRSGVWRLDMIYLVMLDASAEAVKTQQSAVRAAPAWIAVFGTSLEPLG